MEIAAVKLPPDLSGRSGVVLDTMVLVYYFEAHPDFGPRSKAIIETVEAGHFEAAITPVTLAEVMVKPMKKGRSSLVDIYRQAMQCLSGVKLKAITPETGFLAGSLRAKYGLPLPDMFQVAVALQSARPAIITNDRLLRKVKEVDVFLLSDFN